MSKSKDYRETYDNKVLTVLKMVGLSQTDQSRHMVLILGRGGAQRVCGDGESQKNCWED